MASDAKAERLRKLPLFKGADKDAIEHLAAAADEVTVEAGHTLISQGRHHQEMYVLESGAAVVEIDGRQVAEVVAGEFVGELGYFTKAPASATVRTVAESRTPGDSLQPVRADPRRQPQDGPSDRGRAGGAASGRRSPAQDDESLTLRAGAPAVTKTEAVPVCRAATV